jgi:hypothetical protein
VEWKSLTPIKGAYRNGSEKSTSIHIFLHPDILFFTDKVAWPGSAAGDDLLESTT